MKPGESGCANIYKGATLLNLAFIFKALRDLADLASIAVGSGIGATRVLRNFIYKLKKSIVVSRKSSNYECG